MFICAVFLDLEIVVLVCLFFTGFYGKYLNQY